MQHSFIDAPLSPQLHAITFNSPAISWKGRTLPDFVNPCRHYQHADDPVLRLSLIRLNDHQPQCGLLPGRVKTFARNKGARLEDLINPEVRAWNHRRLLTLSGDL